MRQEDDIHSAAHPQGVKDGNPKVALKLTFCQTILGYIEEFKKELIVDCRSGFHTLSSPRVPSLARSKYLSWKGLPDLD